MKKIRELIVFTAFLVVALWKFDVVIEVLKSIWKIVFPFALGGAIAFVINVPMSFLEKKMLGKIKENNKIGKKAARPISLLLTIILVAGVIILVMFGVIPQLTQHTEISQKRRKSQLCDSFGSRCPEYQTCYAFQHRKA